jgi:hypothetical protein
VSEMYVKTECRVTATWDFEGIFILTIAYILCEAEPISLSALPHFHGSKTRLTETLGCRTPIDHAWQTPFETILLASRQS